MHRLPIVIAVTILISTFFVLTGCNNGFYQQKYTRFGHPSHDFKAVVSDNRDNSDLQNPIAVDSTVSSAAVTSDDTVLVPVTYKSSVLRSEHVRHTTPAPDVFPVNHSRKKNVQSPSEGPSTYFFIAIIGVVLLFTGLLLAIGVAINWWIVLGIIALLVALLLLGSYRKRNSGTASHQKTKSGGQGEENDNGEYSQENKETAKSNIRVLGFLAAVFAFASIVAMVLGISPLAAMILLSLTMIFLLLQGIWLAGINRRRVASGDTKDDSLKERTTIAFTLAAVTFILATFWLIVKFL